MFLRRYLAQVLSTLLACFIEGGVCDHSVVLEVLDSLSSVKILKESSTQEKKTTCEKMEKEEKLKENEKRLTSLCSFIDCLQRRMSGVSQA